MGQDVLQAGNIKQQAYYQQLFVMKQKRQQREVNPCSICLQRNSNTSLDGCSHEFCIRCIKKWSKKHNTCPLCRQNYRQMSYKDRVIEVAVPERTVRRQNLQLTHSQPERRTVYMPVNNQVGFNQVNSFGLMSMPMMNVTQVSPFWYSSSFPNLGMFPWNIQLTSYHLNMS